MAAVERVSNNPYEVRFVGVPVSQVSNQEKKVPRDFINEAGNDVTDKMMAYLNPLIEGEAPVIYENGFSKHVSLY